MKRRDPTILIALLVALGAHLAILSFGDSHSEAESGLVAANARHSQVAQRPAVQDPTQQLGEHNSNGPSINTARGSSRWNRPWRMQGRSRRRCSGMRRGSAGRNRASRLSRIFGATMGMGHGAGTNSSADGAAAVFGSQELRWRNRRRRYRTRHRWGRLWMVSRPGGTAIDPLSSGPLPVKPPTEASKGQPASGSPSNAQDANQSQQAKASSQGGAGGTPGSAESGSGKSGSFQRFESYPVSRIASRFIAGKIKRTGRKMKAHEFAPARLEAIADLQEMQNPYVVLLLKIGTDRERHRRRRSSDPAEATPSIWNASVRRTRGGLNR